MDIHDGLRTSSKRLARLMQAGDLKARAARIYRRMPGTTAFFAKVPNRLPEHVTGPNQVWVGDITFLRVPGSWRQLAAVMDKYSRRIVGWSLADNRTTAITVAAFDYFFHSLKSEELAGRRFASEDELLGAIRSYIPRYTSRRLHSSLGMRSPIDYERLAA